MSDIKGMKMPRGKRESIIRFEFPVPPLGEQERIVREVAVLEGRIAAAKRTIAECKTKKAAVLEKYL